MKRFHQLLLCLLCISLLFTGCGSEEFSNMISQIKGDIKKLNSDTTYENKYLGMTFTAPKDWWLYDLNEPAFDDATSVDPLLWSVEGFEGTEEYYADLIHIGNQRDTSSMGHATFMIFVENFPEMESLEDFANLTALFYDNTEDGYTSANYGMEMLMHNDTLYYRVDFETTHPDNEVGIICHYYVCEVQGLFVTVYIDYWEGEAGAMREALAVLDSLRFSKGASRRINA